MKNKLFASVPNILFGALITIAPQTFAHACTGHDMPGACHYSQQAATGIGVVILVFGVVALFVAPQIRIGLNIAAAADALLLLAVPTFLIGICKGAMMHCRMHGYAAHAHRARRAHHRVRGHRHLARLSRRQAQLIEQTAGAQPLRTLDSGLAYCNRTISNIRIHRAIPYRIARPSD